MRHHPMVVYPFGSLRLSSLTVADLELASHNRFNDADTLKAIERERFTRLGQS